MIKKILFAVIVLAIIGGSIGYYMYNKPVASIENKKPDITLNAGELLSAYETDEAMANEKFGEKIIQVTGTVSEVRNDAEAKKIFIETDNPMSGVICEMESDQDISGVNAGDQVTVKGRCTGYLSDVVLVQSSLVQ